MDIKGVIILLIITVIGGVIVVTYEHETYPPNPPDNPIDTIIIKKPTRTNSAEYKHIIQISNEFEQLINKIELDNINDLEENAIFNKLMKYGNELNEYYLKHEDCYIGKKLMLFYKFYIKRLNENGVTSNVSNYQNAYNRIKNNCN